MRIELETKPKTETLVCEKCGSTDVVYGENQFEKYTFCKNCYNQIILHVKKERCVPKCPTCGSSDLSKVSTMATAGSVMMWGLLSQKVKKTWHCNNCKYEW